MTTKPNCVRQLAIFFVNRASLFSLFVLGKLLTDHICLIFKLIYSKKNADEAALVPPSVDMTRPDS